MPLPYITDEAHIEKSGFDENHDVYYDVRIAEFGIVVRVTISPPTMKHLDWYWCSIPPNWLHTDDEAKRAKQIAKEIVVFHRCNYV